MGIFIYLFLALFRGMEAKPPLETDVGLSTTANISRVQVVKQSSPALLSLSLTDERCGT